MVGEVVVVFDGLQRCGLAEEAEVVDWDRDGEEGLYCLGKCEFRLQGKGGWGK